MRRVRVHAGCLPDRPPRLRGPPPNPGSLGRLPPDQGRPLTHNLRYRSPLVRGVLFSCLSPLCIAARKYLEAKLFEPEPKWLPQAALEER